jgi:hypothetical protein
MGIGLKLHAKVSLAAGGYLNSGVHHDDVSILILHILACSEE